MLPLTDVSVVIVNWNTAGLLEDCLRSIYEHTQGIAYQVCVVDNASTDHSVAMVTTQFPQVIIRRNETNRGFAAANNQGIGASRGRYVVLLNSDTVVRTGSLAGMVTYADGHRDVGIVGPRLIDSSGVVEESGQQFSSAWKSLAANSRVVRGLLPRRVTEQLLVRGWESVTPCDVGYVSGACMLVRREALRQVGALDEDYFMYGEEIDWCFRMRSAGWRVVYYPQVEILHLRNRSGALKWAFGGLAARKIAERRFYRKAYGRVAAASFTSLHVFLSLVRFLGYLALSVLPAGTECRSSVMRLRAEKYRLSFMAMIGLYTQKDLASHPN